MTALHALYLISALAGVAAGLFNPLVSALMVAQGHAPAAVGLVQSVFFLSLLLAAAPTRALVRRRGARAAIAAGLLLSAASALPLPLLEGLPAWLAARAAMGAGLALYLIGGQTALGALAPDAGRALAGALHGLAFGIGLGLGPLAGTALFGVSPVAAFAGGAALLLLGLPLALRALPPLAVGAAAPDFGLARRLAAPLVAVFAYGVAEATLLTMFPVALLQLGRPLAEVGTATAAFVAGGLLAALPFGHLADRVGRERVLAALALSGAAATAALGQGGGVAGLGLLSAVAGASLGPVYAIALALVGQRLAAAELAAGCALFTMAFGLGSMLAPWASALVLQWAGAHHVFTLTAALFAALVGVLAWPAVREQRA